MAFQVCWGRRMSRVKVGRNDLCPCRSGLKFKKCCLEKHAAIPLEKMPDRPPNNVYLKPAQMFKERERKEREYKEKFRPCASAHFHPGFWQPYGCSEKQALSRQMEILELAKTRGEITVKEIEECTGANRNTIKVHVKKLATDNYLAQVGKGRGARYTEL
jgi:predicted HTH transcriptional regulator